MQLIIFLLAIFILPFESAQGGQGRCGKAPAAEKFVYSDDFKRNYGLEDMAAAFKDTYESGARLKGRAYYDEAAKSYVLPHHTGLVKIDRTFIKSVSRHIELALERRYADFVFFPDMGHSHLHIPAADYERLKSVAPQSKMYEGMFAYRQLQMLYHTAEKLTVRSGERMNGEFPPGSDTALALFFAQPSGR